ncbi:OLC1v1006005C1 [Oldenlandia corymbosa var. corymbosa]|uniref:OLC1v1006005C1 n=1 Tax=Oldenlandia corymbosa var. corymbosa TaxID=529605 RepID=A0AAV1DH99_OLDCO|nr:OLC1v1006005C1 [Oldenlandia corymbosa var. corymbosa]
MAGSATSVSMELFIGPRKHQPLDSDGTIPSNHLRSFEHSNISLTFFMYALFSIILDRIRSPAKYGLTLFSIAVAFGQELLIFHLHSTGHNGVEGQYHWLLQILIFVSFFTTLLSIGYPKNFLNSFIRSVSILFQGVWLMVMGFMIWTPELLPKGCFLNFEDGHHVARCHNNEALERAKSLVNIEFNWYLIGVTVFVLSLYLAIFKVSKAEEKVEFEYQSVPKFEIREDDDDEEVDVEAQKSSNNNNIVAGQPMRLLPVRKPFAAPADMER